nr:LysR substrate-binding domain-containing protein [Nocardiopsis algeriensis]
MLREARAALDAVEAAVHRTRRAANPQQPLVLATKAGASHDILRRLLDAVAVEPDAVPVDVLLCEVGEQAGLLRSGRADAALMHRPFDDLAGFDTEDLHTEGQVALLPADHPLALRKTLSLAEAQNVPDLPIARWPRLDGSYPDGPGPEVRTQSQLAQLVALGKTLLVIPASSRAWQWPEHVAVPVVDAPEVTTVIAWPPGSRSRAVAALVRTASALGDTVLAAPEG